MTPLNIHTAEEHQHQTFCGDVILERTEHQEIVLYTNFLLIPSMGLKVYDILVSYRDTVEEEFEPSFGGLMLFDMVTNEFCYEEGQSGLYPTLHNYLWARGEGVEEGLDEVQVLLYDPAAKVFYSHVDEQGNLSLQTSPPHNICFDLPKSVILPK